MSIIGYSCYKAHSKKQKFDNIVTLGPKKTSSYYVSQKFLNNNILSCKDIITKNNFDDVHKYLCENIKSLAIIPNAWLGINNFYIHKDLELVSSFLCDTMPYYFAGKLQSIEEYKSPLKISTHPAPSIMIESFLSKKTKHETIFTESTELAAQMIVNNKADICLSNELAIKDSNLNQLSPSFKISMLWSVFKNKNYQIKGQHV